jgi:hypothetical protein
VAPVGVHDEEVLRAHLARIADFEPDEHLAELVNEAWVMKGNDKPLSEHITRHKYSCREDIHSSVQKIYHLRLQQKAQQAWDAPSDGDENGAYGDLR